MNFFLIQAVRTVTLRHSPVSTLVQAWSPRPLRYEKGKRPLVTSISRVGRADLHALGGGDGSEGLELCAQLVVIHSVCQVLDVEVHALVLRHTLLAEVVEPVGHRERGLRTGFLCRGEGCERRVNSLFDL